MTRHSNPIEEHHDKLFHCQIKAVREENPNMTEAEVYERALQLHAQILEAEERRLNAKSRRK